MQVVHVHVYKQKHKEKHSAANASPAGQDIWELSELLTIVLFGEHQLPHCC